MHLIRRRILVRGVVQGVGFRPFVYREAVQRGLRGAVRNLGDAGVEILVEGDSSSVDLLLDALRSEAPPLADIQDLDIEALEPTGEASFLIAPSGGGNKGHGSIPPDTAVCPACVEDIRNATRYADYWATSCTDCGPRFTVIEGLPYDRPRTSMADFPMCEACASEYTNPLDRRYHAQTIACPVCGPRLTFDGAEDDPIGRAAAALESGRIVAVKGIGGTHIACDATSESVVEMLRERLRRPGQPFALMASEPIVERISVLDTEERALLRSPRRPIVVLRRREGALPEAIAPGLHTVGVMLPYSGFHVLLFDRIESPLVMTSANLPGRPMLIENESIRARLADVVDHFVLHDRRIVARCDDSVQRRVAGRPVFLRRSRGHVPDEIRLDLGEAPLLALGPESGLTFALYHDGRVALSQHIGSVDDVESYEFLSEAIDHLKKIGGFPEPKVVACDLHPGFLTTRLARELARDREARLVPVQHHVAHLASAMAEHELDRAVGLILDGYGYGADGEAWGGELLVGSNGSVERVGSLQPVRLPGGDAAARQPLRMVASFLRAAGLGRSEIEGKLRATGLAKHDLDATMVQIDRGLNAPWTTSAGRFLDAVAGWLGICVERTYEGEPAMRLEGAASRGTPFDLEAKVERRDGFWVVDTARLFCELAEASERRAPEDVAATAQTALAEGVAEAAIAVAEERGIGHLLLSGGVAYNDAIARRIRTRVEAAGLTYGTNERVPCGDGGVSLGQAVFAGLGWRLLEADRADAAAGCEDRDCQ